MNNLLSDVFGSGLGDVMQAARAAIALGVLPAYYLILFAIGAYLFFRSRRLRIEHIHQVDLVLGEFPAIAKRFGEHDTGGSRNGRSKGKKGQGSRSWPFKRGGKKDDPARTEADEVAEDIEEVLETEPYQDQSISGEEFGEPASSPTREGVWQLAVHDAPLMAISAFGLSLVYALISLLAPAMGGDPLTRLMQSAPVENSEVLMRHLLFGNEGFFFPMLGYTLLGGVALAVAPSIVARALNLEWVHLEPFSRRSRLVRRLWRNLCFVNLHRLDGSVGHWLVAAVPVYLVLLFLADATALFYGFALPPALAAAAHLFPAALPRMFAPVWDSPIDFSRTPGDGRERIPVEDLPEHLSAEAYLGGLSEGAEVKLLDRVTLPASNPIIHDEKNLDARMRHGLEVISRVDLAPFLGHALEQLLDLRTSVVVSGPKGSGRTSIVQLCAFETAFRGGATLILVRNAAAAERLQAALARFAAEFPSIGCLKIASATDELLYEVREYADEVDILICELSSFERAAEDEDNLAVFWDRLDLAVLLDMDTASPLHRIELPFILKRINALSRCAPDGLPTLLTVLDGGREDQKAMTTLLCRRFVEIPLGHASAARIDILSVSVPGRKAITFDTDQDIFTRFGAGMADAGYRRYFLSIRPRVRGSLERLDQATWTTRAEDFVDENVVVSLVRLQSETLFNQLSEIRELSRSCRSGHHICLLMEPADGFDAWIHSQVGDFLEMRSDHLAPTMLTAEGNPLIAIRHMLRAVFERETTISGLAGLFGPRSARLLGQLGEAESPRLARRNDPLLGEVYTVDRAEILACPWPPLGSGAVTGGPGTPAPARIVCPELGLERLADASRLESVFWSGRVFSLAGERVRVDGAAVDGVLVCSPEADDVVTRKIRQLFVKGARDISLASDHVFASEGIGIYRSRLELGEIILGYRSWKGRDLFRETLYGVDGQIETSYQAEAAVLFLPGFDEEMTHLLAHVVKRHLRIMIGDTEDVVDVAHGCFEPFSKGVSSNVYRDVTVVDNIPGGCGVCDLVTPEFLRKVAAHIVAMHDGGAEWYDMQDCHFTHRPVFDQVLPGADSATEHSTAERLVDQLRKTILAEQEDDGREPLDYACNIWAPDEQPDPLPAALSHPGDQPHEPTFLESTPPLAEMLARVYADTNRIGRPPLSRASEGE
jgi:hypothetical protein